ncbi:unnamed protein product [Linum trigynum]|uniref:Uncharacterized protein n=1 Tax=Linum trigynum TaxID=586398 RepID=A0AAV2FLR8_9ROSI
MKGTSINSLSHLAALSASSSYFILHSADSSMASLLARSNCLLQNPNVIKQSNQVIINRNEPLHINAATHVAV